MVMHAWFGQGQLEGAGDPWLALEAQQWQTATQSGMKPHIFKAEHCSIEQET